MPGIVKERLYTPGPTPLLLEAQARTLTATLHHRTESFRRLIGETLENLKYFFKTQNDVVMLTSSGTGAMEASFTNLLSPGDRALVGTAGKFGERWLELARAYGIEAGKV
ncbi:MAG: alanine--glyoxylate aminotransferase family protein, partial [Acidobacteria bacterium]